MEKKDKKFQITKQHITFAGLLVVLAGVALMPGEDEPEFKSQATKKTSIGKQDVDNQTQFANVPKRFNSAPNYDDAVMASKIIKQAIDGEEAKHFVHLKVSERNLRLQSKVAELEAKLSKQNLEKAKADSEIARINSNDVHSDGSFVQHGELPETTSIVAYDEQGQLINTQGEKDFDAIRIVGWSNDEISASINDEEYASNIRENQVLWGRYRVEQIDPSLECVSFYDAKNHTSIPDVCFH